MCRLVQKSVFSDCVLLIQQFILLWPNALALSPQPLMGVHCREGLSPPSVGIKDALLLGCLGTYPLLSPIPTCPYQKRQAYAHTKRGRPMPLPKEVGLCPYQKRQAYAHTKRGRPMPLPKEVGLCPYQKRQAYAPTKRGRPMPLPKEVGLCPYQKRQAYAHTKRGRPMPLPKEVGLCPCPKTTRPMPMPQNDKPQKGQSLAHVQKGLGLCIYPGLTHARTLIMMIEQLFAFGYFNTGTAWQLCIPVTTYTEKLFCISKQLQQLFVYQDENNCMAAPM